MNRTVRLTPAALEELREAADWYEDQRAGLGDDFVDAVAEAAASVAEWPGIGSRIEVRGRGFRRIGVAGFPYHLPYRVSDEVVEVLAVAHDRRRPGYWVDRRP